MRCLPFYFFFLHFSLYSLLPVLHQHGCCIINFGVGDHWQYFTVASNCQDGQHPSFLQPFPEGSSNPWSYILPPRQHVSYLVCQLRGQLLSTSVTAETTIKWQKNAIGCPQARSKSCWKGCPLADHKDSLSFLFPAKHLKEEEEEVAETSGGTRTTISDCCNCSPELWHSSQRLRHYLHKTRNCCLLCSYQFIAVKAINWHWTPFLPAYPWPLTT